MKNLVRVLRFVYVRIRYGKLTAINKADVANVVSEVAYIDKYGIERGYWAYGYYDPRQPYQGDIYGD